MSNPETTPKRVGKLGGIAEYARTGARAETTGWPVYGARNSVCREILAIMQTYHQQETANGYVDTPGGLEHMGDVWDLFLRWEKELLNEQA